MAKLDAALAYALKGWAVLPLRGKLPAISKEKGGRGVHDATTDREKIKTWWAKDPNANIGIACGKPSGIWALDVDGDEGEESLAELQAKRGTLPDTVEQLTGNGRHLLFKFTGENVQNSVKFKPGLDTRAGGGYIVVAPSYHQKSGREYAWEVDHHPDDIEVKAAPDWLLKLVFDRPEPPKADNGSTVDRFIAFGQSTPKPASYGKAALDAEAEATRSAPIGSQENTLNAAALKIGQLISSGALDFDQARETLIAAGLDMANDPQKKPWTASEITAKVERGLRDGMAKPRHLDSQAGSTKTNDPRPVIRLTAGRLPDIASEGEIAIIKAALPIYRRGAALVRPVVEEVEAARGRRTHVAQLARIDAPYLRDVLARVARWEKYNIRKRAWVAADPPHEAAVTLLARFGEWSFPPVIGILTTPTLRPDGTILNVAGYDKATRLLLMAPPTLPAIPDAPTRDDALAALATLESLLEEFPLTDGSSLSVALSALITPIVRGTFTVAPMHVARAPVAASGKSYLIDVAAAICIGAPAPVMAAGRTEEETEKRLGAALLAGQPMISIDNLNGELRGDALCQAVERPVVEIRILGRSERIRIEARATTFFCTGNNVQVAGDMTRRVIVATLDPQIERPELRKFRGNPVADVLTDRGQYIAAALTICRAYIAAGRPDPAPALASFEGWSDTVRSALIWLDRADPVETMELARTEDPDLANLRTLLAAWSDVLGTGSINRYTLPTVLKTIDDTSYTGSGEYHETSEREYHLPELRDAVLAVAISHGRPDARRFGYWARRFKGRVVDGRRLCGQTDKYGHAVKWWIELI